MDVNVRRTDRTQTKIKRRQEKEGEKMMKT